MAAVTVGKRYDKVAGDLRVIILKPVTIAADTDTFETGLNTVLHVSATSNTNAAVGYTLSGSQVIFQTGGAETLTSCIIYGT